MLDISDHIRDIGTVPVPAEWTVEVEYERDNVTRPDDRGSTTLPDDYDLTPDDLRAFERGDWWFEAATCRIREADGTVVGELVVRGIASGHLPYEDMVRLPWRDDEFHEEMAALTWDLHATTLSKADMIRSHLAAREIDAHLAQKDADRSARGEVGCRPSEPGDDVVLISDVCARTVAELYHAGNGTVGHVFARTGAIPEQVDTLINDLFRDMPAIQRRLQDGTARPSRGELFGDVETANLAVTLLRYLVTRGARGEVAGWREQQWEQGSR